MNVLVVALGAAIGAPCRFLLDRFIQARHRTGFPWGLVVVNLLGSFILGVISAVALHHDVPQLWVLGGTTGWCGAFTTYSSFGWETVQLARTRQAGRAALNAGLTVIGGLGAVALGLWAGGL